MEYNIAITFLANELGVKESQLKRSFSRTKTLKKIETEKAAYAVEEADPNRFIGNCFGKVPLKMYLIKVTEGENKSDIVVYNHKITWNGIDKTLASTSPASKKQVDLEDCDLTPTNGPNFDELPCEQENRHKTGKKFYMHY